jgi:hypothetical protein
MKNISIILLILISLSFGANAQNQWTFEVLSGDAHCFKTALTIKQSGYDDINLKAKYATNSFKFPIYYSLRIAKWNHRKAWELDLVHLKIKLKNNPPEVQRFEISHGFNLLIFNRMWAKRNYTIRIGGGVVIAHPENTVRGKKLPENAGIFEKGYYIAGSTVQFSIGKVISLFQNLNFIIEGKLTGAFARIPVQDGYSRVTHVAIHGLVGLGYRF